MVNARTKGNKAERMAAQLLSDWSGKDFHRTPSSGGLHWKKDNRVAGDIVPPDKLNFPFVVEVKSYKKGKLDILDFAECKGRLPIFWDKLIGESKQLNKVPLLLYRYNGMPKGCFIGITYYNVLSVWIRTAPWHFRLRWRHGMNEVVIFDMMELALCNEFDDICKSASKFVAK